MGEQFIALGDDSLLRFMQIVKVAYVIELTIMTNRTLKHLQLFRPSNSSNANSPMR